MLAVVSGCQQIIIPVIPAFLAELMAMRREPLGPGNLAGAGGGCSIWKHCGRSLSDCELRRRMPEVTAFGDDEMPPQQSVLSCETDLRYRCPRSHAIAPPATRDAQRELLCLFRTRRHRRPRQMRGSRANIVRQNKTESVQVREYSSENRHQSRAMTEGAARIVSTQRFASTPRPRAVARQIASCGMPAITARSL
ncbi:hypothetical protein OE88DRAFT_905234 [Heliocybe sulcata]|uniref:Uncharacterized protein n=1 Tax=Heliocybe sulcata TaxID=5364 RepID=A0A5C3MNJ7_9AGAM|nr:hypothetical protein OE88DRAFT_905234 [Heliocybe sulcata]